ncbi:hypothetical protein Salat_2578000, partial [Sesamum alatum]
MRPILWLDKVMDREIDDAIMLTHSANTRKRGNIFPTRRPVPGFGKLMDSILLTTIKKHYSNGAKPALSFISSERRGSFRSLQSGPATNRLYRTIPLRTSYLTKKQTLRKKTLHK